MKRISKGLILFCVIVPIIASLIGYNIALEIEAEHRANYRNERDEYKADYDKKYKEQQEVANKTFLELRVLLLLNDDWERYKINMLEALDIADDEYSLIFDLEKGWMKEFVRKHCDRNSKEKKLLRKYEQEYPEFKIGDYEIYPFPLQDFKSYKISLRPRTLFVEFEPHVSAAIIGAITLGICVLIGFIYSVIKQNKT